MGRRIGRIDLDGGAERRRRVRQLKIGPGEQVRTSAAHELIHLDGGQHRADVKRIVAAQRSLDGRDEPISGAWHRFDTHRTSRGPIERLPKTCDMDAEDAFLDEAVRPHPREQLLFSHKLARLAQESDEEIEGFRRQAHGMTASS